MSWKAVVTGMLFVLVSQAAQSLEAKQWQADLDEVLAQLERTHPDPWHSWARAEALAELDQLRDALPELTDAQIAVRLMQWVARLGDTHTNLLPNARVGFEDWFPLRIYEFEDGYFVTAIHRNEGSLAGARVLRIGKLTVEEAANRVRTLRSAENESGRREALHYLASPAALHAMDVIDDPGRLSLVLQDSEGAQTEVRLTPLKAYDTMVWTQWGEMFGPIFEDRSTLRTAFDGLSPRQYRDANEQRPPHLRNRGRYAFWHLAEHSSVYAQINFFVDDDDAPFEESFMPELFGAVDRFAPEKLILDLRYNGGGDGSMAIPFVNELIKREHSINQPGRLYVLVGRKTFSASVSFLGEVKDHTAAIFVGEPPRSPYNHFGDPTSIDLPNSGMQLDVSNRYWQFSTSDDESPTIPVRYPAPFSSDDYFAGKDPALDAILAGRVLPIPTLIRDAGGAVALALIDEIEAAVGRPSWWIPFDRRDMRRTGRALIEKGRLEDGLAAYRLNVRFHGESWRVWDSLGDGLRAAGDVRGAIDAYERALRLKPDNWNAEHQRTMIAELTSK